jgi:hypothetical protein
MTSDDARLARIETKVDQVLKILPDHEERLRSIERDRGIARGALIVIGAAVSAAVALLVGLVTGE